jgi:uncharacterized protein (TIGR03067 family)
MRQALQVLLIGTVVVCSGCGKGAKNAPVGKNVDSKITSEEIRSMASTWKYERQVVEGSEVPLTEMASQSIVIAKNTLTRNVAAGGQTMAIKSLFAVDPTVNPKQMDEDVQIGTKTSRRVGIYKIEGDVLTLCYDNEGNKRPTTFESPAKSSFVLSVLRRQR